MSRIRSIVREWKTGPSAGDTNILIDMLEGRLEPSLRHPRQELRSGKPRPSRHKSPAHMPAHPRPH